MRQNCCVIALVLGLGLALTTLWLSSGGLSARAATIEVPAAELHVCAQGCPYTSIQAAVNAANPDDTIKIAQGTYSDIHHAASLDTATFTATQIVVITKTVTLQGGYTTTNWTTPYPDTQPTILDAQGGGRGMVITGTISPIIQGLHITGGDAAGLGGTWWGDGVGGGIYIDSASATLVDNAIYSNTAKAYGGGLYLIESPTIISKTLIVENVTQDRGGGVYLDNSPATLSGNTICNNITYSEGGGVCTYWSQATISNNIFENNSVIWRGGGMYLYGEGGTLNANRFINNQAGDSGGGLFLQYVLGNIPMLINNALVGNQAPAGSGIWFEGSKYSYQKTVQVLHTTLHDNRGGGEAIFIGEYASMALTNTIIVSHTMGITATAGSTLTLDSTLWHNNNGGNWGGAGSISHAHDYNGDPVFAADGYHLTAKSAAINKGVDAGVTVDIDGDPRNDGGYDLGADEFAQRIFLPILQK